MFCGRLLCLTKTSHLFFSCILPSTWNEDNLYVCLHNSTVWRSSEATKEQNSLLHYINSMCRGANSQAIDPLLLLESEQFPPSCMAVKVWDAQRTKMGFLYHIPLLRYLKPRNMRACFRLCHSPLWLKMWVAVWWYIRQQFDLSMQYSLPYNASPCPHASLSFVSSRGLGMGKLSAMTSREWNYSWWRISNAWFRSHPVCMWREQGFASRITQGQPFHQGWTPWNHRAELFHPAQLCWVRE